MAAEFTPTITRVSEDARGEMYVITLPGDRELLLLHSVAGSFRGGHAHTVDEIVVMLAGAMRYHKRSEAGKEAHGEVLKGGQGSFNEKGLVHLGEFTEDSWLIEWKIDTHNGAWKNLEYAPWREKVAANAAG